jgi:tetratricopeptide (TPR) repeat protein
VELFARNRRSKAGVDDDDDDSDANHMKAVTMEQRYSMNYSRWDTWVPQDPATVQEVEAKKAEEEKKQNDVFEKSNPDFCKEFLADQAKREEALKKKETSADVARLKGNRYYQRKDFEPALTHYMEALKLCPYDVKTLTNIAQVHIKQENNEDALEFLSRTLYIEPNHVKALSRKAHVLSITGQAEEALTTARQALKLEPTTADLVAQVRDLEAVVKESQDEAALRKLMAAAPTASPAATAGTSPAEVKENENVSNTTATAPAPVVKAPAGAGIATAAVSQSSAEVDVAVLQVFVNELIDEVKVIAPTVDVCESGPHNGAGLSGDGKRLFEELKRANNGSSVQACGSLLSKDSMLRVYLRTSNLLKDSLLVALKGLVDLVSADAFDSSSNERVVSSTVLLLELACVAIKGERSSKMQLIDSQALTVVMNKVLTSSWVLRNHSLLAAALGLVCVCGEDDVCPRAQKLVHTNRTVFSRVGAIIGETSTLLASLLITNPACASCLTVLDRASQLVRYFNESEDGKGLLQSGDADIGTAVVALGTGLQVVVDKHRDVEQCMKEKLTLTVDVAQLENSTEHLVAALLNMSQVAPLRKYFGVTMPSTQAVFASKALSKTKPPKSGASDNTSSAVGALIALMSFKKVHSVNCFAIIMNALLDSENVVKDEVVRLNLCDFALAGLIEFQGSEATDDDIDCLRNRYAGLLSRMVTSVGSSLATDASFRVICKEFAWAVRHRDDTANTSAEQRKWRGQEVGHVVRLIAGLPKPTVTMGAIAIEENVFELVISLLPMPRTELGEVTPQSVILTPADMPPALLIGNAARLLLQFADDSNCAAVMFGMKPSSSSKSTIKLSVEKLICCMASCTDIPVRKNIAIVLAKGSRIPDVREKVQHFRGMQMIVELQNRIL